MQTVRHGSTERHAAGDGRADRAAATGRVKFTISCVQSEDETLRFIGEAKGPENKEL